MKIKHLPILSGLLFTTLMATSCLKSDNKTLELATDATVHSIRIDTVLGKEVPLTIDQIQNYIFNKDSLPVASDTIINKFLIKEIRTGGLWLTRKIKGSDKDTIFDYVNDSIDLTSPFTFKVYAMDSEISREYTLDIRVHQQDPDSLVWNKKTLDFDWNKEKSFVNAINNEIFLYTPDQQAFSVKSPNASDWKEITPNGLDDSNILSIINNQGKDKLYALTAHAIYESSNGIEWQDLNLGDNIEHILAVTNDQKLMAIRKKANVLVFDVADLETGEWANKGKEVPESFTAQNISTTYYAKSNVVMLMCQPQSEADNTIAWMSEFGTDWGKMESTSTEKQCPYFEQPHLIHYNNMFYAFGGDYSTIYESINGIDWSIVKTKFLLPPEFKDLKNCALTIDANNYIWVNWQSSNSLWRGRLNKFGHIIQ